jgi:hypothetical protein
VILTLPEPEPPEWQEEQVDSPGTPESPTSGPVEYPRSSVTKRPQERAMRIGSFDRMIDSKSKAKALAYRGLK